MSDMFDLDFWEGLNYSGQVLLQQIVIQHVQMRSHKVVVNKFSFEMLQILCNVN